MYNNNKIFDYFKGVKQLVQSMSYKCIRLSNLPWSPQIRKNLEVLTIQYINSRNTGLSETVSCSFTHLR
jgi:hypothetical protein